MFHYTSVQTHQVMTPTGKKVKETMVKVKGDEGVKKVSIKDENGVHSDTIPLKKSELKNIKNHIFMPKLFHPVIKNVMRKKNTYKHNSSKKGTRKSKK